MLTLDRLCNPPVPVRLERCTLHIRAQTLAHHAEWEAWLRWNHVDSVRRRAAQFPVADRDALVSRARERAKSITAGSPEAAAALRRVDGCLVFACLSLRRDQPQITPESLASLLTSFAELEGLVSEINTLESARAPEVNPEKLTLPAGPIDYAPLVHSFASEFGFLPEEVAGMTMGQIDGLVRGMNGEVDTTHAKTGRRMRRFKSRAEAEAFLAEQRAARTDKPATA